MSKEMNIEESIKVLEKIKEMFLHLKNYGWIEDLKRDFDTDKTIQAIEKVLRGLNRYIESDYETICLENNHLLEQLEKEEERRKCSECNFETLQADINSVIKDLGLTEDLIIADEMVQEIKQKYISKDKIKDRQMQREFELQQEYKDFEDDVEWNVYQKLLKESE